jgi:serine/threonine protein kinase
VRVSNDTFPSTRQAGAHIVADFKTTLRALSRGEVEFDAVSENLARLLMRQPHLAVSIMEQLREAYGEDLIDAANYARLKKVVAEESAPDDDPGSDPTKFDTTDPTRMTNSDATQFSDDDDGDSIAEQARAAISAATESSSLDFDLTGDSLPSDGSWRTGGAETGGTAAGWAGSPGAPAGEAKIEPGSVLKDRFKLDDVLGIGGMGTVYRGRDLIKVEARDKNPFVALKVLNEDFKRHPDSFIALQREASRQQKLAHPNIATVYDFDRTRGGTVFLTMELLEGEPLNTFIKKKVRPKGGLPFDEAFPMIEGLGNALIYAHEHSIVHSDFKPGNCFQTKDGVMKVLDFGIARAVKNPGQGDGEKTLFDPGKLGALTPAYASAEMLEGEEPDPRDDLYALACVAYELLTGKHPFNKLPANSARDNNLVPAPVKGLKRKQMKGLMRGLAFAREDRSQNVAEFLEQLEGKTSPFRNPFIVVPAAIVIIGLAGVAPALNYVHERGIEQTIALVKSGNPEQVNNTLDALNSTDFDASDRDRILVASRTEILQHFQNQVDERVDVEAGRYDFAGANAVIDRVAAMDVFKDSAQVQDWRERIENVESVLLNEQTVLFNTAVAENRLLPVDGRNDVHDALGVIAKFAPAAVDSLKRRLPGQYSAAIDRAIVNEEFELAKKLSEAGLDAVPGNKNLKNLIAKIDGAEERVQTTRDILEYTARIQDAIDSGERLAEFLPISDNVKNLSRLDPGSAILKDLARKVGPVADKEIAELNRSKAWGSSDLVQNDYGDLLRSLGMRDKDVKAAKLRNEFDATVVDYIMRVSAAVAADKLAPPATPNANALVADLEAIAPGHERTLQAREIAARGYLGKARLSRAAHQFDAAANQLAAARAIAGESDVGNAIEKESAIVTDDQAADPAGLESRIANRHAAFEQGLPQAEATFAYLEPDPAAIGQALTRFDALATLNPADPRLDTLRNLLVDGINSVSELLGQAEKWSEAVAITRAMLAYAPGSETLSGNLVTLEERQREAALEEQRRYVADRKREVESLFGDPNATREWNTQIQRNMADIQILSEPSDPWLAEYKNKIAAIYLAKATTARENERFAAGANLLERAARYTPDSPALAAERQALAGATEAFEREQREQERLARVEGLKQDFTTQANANDVVSATKTLQQLESALGASDEFVARTAPRMLADGYYKLATKKAQEQDFAAALKLAKAGLALKPNSQELRLAVKDYTVDGNKQDLARTFGRGGEFDLADVLEKISEVQTLDPRAYSESESGWANGVVSRIQALQESDGEASNPLLDEAKDVFAGNPLIAALKPAAPVLSEPPAIAREIGAAMDAALLTKARDLLKSVSPEDANHDAVVQLKGRYNALIKKPKELNDEFNSVFRNGRGDLDRSAAIMREALGLWGDSDLFQRKLAEVARLQGSGGEPPPPASKLPCSTKLAGHGKRKKGTCFDMVTQTARGPLMVVVPAGENFSRPFAIGKYETTVGDFNNFCQSSGTCTPISDRESRMPITGVSLEQAKAYAEWLSKRTGHTYRLPSVAEWSYAAEAAGQQPRKDYNCRVEQSGQILKGQSTMGVNTGKANGWGLYNYVGNAQEWVTNGDGVVVRGGAFEDTFSKCSISLEKSHSGTPDKSTGFRLLQELG